MCVQRSAGSLPHKTSRTTRRRTTSLRHRSAPSRSTSDRWGNRRERRSGRGCRHKPHRWTRRCRSGCLASHRRRRSRTDLVGRSPGPRSRRGIRLPNRWREVPRRATHPGVRSHRRRPERRPPSVPSRSSPRRRGCLRCRCHCRCRRTSWSRRCRRRRRDRRPRSRRRCHRSMQEDERSCAKGVPDLNPCHGTSYRWTSLESSSRTNGRAADPGRERAAAAGTVMKLTPKYERRARGATSRAVASRGP